jgi:hypothetical protein
MAFGFIIPVHFFFVDVAVNFRCSAAVLEIATAV